jgi:hypothetical protein
MIDYFHDNQELENFKKINLVGFLATKGWKVDYKDSDKKARGFIALRRNETEKLLVKCNGEYYFYVNKRSKQGKGSIIDYLKEHDHLNLGQVRKLLRSYNHSSPPLPIETYQKNTESNFDRKGLVMEWKKWQGVTAHPFLTFRNIPYSTQMDSRFSGTFKMAKYNNIAFPYYDKVGLCGYELKNRNFKYFREGGKKGIWFTLNIKTSEVLYLCESVIDCFSHAALNPKLNQVSYVATGGTMSQLSIQLLKILLLRVKSRNQELIIAVDNDKAGDEMANQIQGLSGEPLTRTRPIGKDWNCDLQLSLRLKII